MTKRLGACLFVLFTLCVVQPASAETRRASIGNYWYEDDATGDRQRIIVKQGDQLALTVREGIYPPHTVDVDELNIHSPGILIGDTYTTPRLDRVGTFRMYCRPHEARGHVTMLVVQGAPVTPERTEAPTEGPATGAAPEVLTTASPSPSPSPTAAPVGISKASPEVLERPIAVDPDSLEGLTGRARSTEPWTRSLWFLLIASIPVVGAAGFSLRRASLRTTGSSPSSSGRRRSTGRSPRSSGRKASGSGRRSGGRPR